MSGYAVEPAQPVRPADNSTQDRHGPANAMAPSAAAGHADTNKHGTISTTQKMISASWGSLLTSVLVTPLDVVRVRLQSQTPVLRVPMPTTPSTLFKELPPNLGVTACCREVFWVGNNAQFCLAGPSVTATTATLPAPGCVVEETQKKTYTSTIDGLRKIARNEGILSLWRGLSPTLVMAIPANVIYFTGYDWLRFDGASPIARYVDDGWAPLVAGSVARITAATAISPIEMFRTRLQATSGEGTDHFRRTLQGLGQLIRANGYSSLWRGLTLTMWRDVPFSGLYWWGYEGVKKQLGEARRVAGLAGSNKTRKHPRMETFVDSFTSGAVSGAAAALITTPFDVGKTRQQVFRHGEELGSGLLASSKTVRPEALSIPRFLQHIWREEGASGLFRGWAARCLKVAPACAIMISSYEVGKQWRS